MASAITADLTEELQAWRLRLQRAETDGSLDTAVLCWRRINHLLDQVPRQRDGD